MDFIRNLTIEQMDAKKPLTYYLLLDKIQYEYGIMLKADTLRHIVRAHPELRTVRGVPMESQRVEVDSERITAWYDQLSSLINQVPAEFIFNVDETGCSDYTDATHTRAKPRLRIHVGFL